MFRLLNGNILVEEIYDDIKIDNINNELIFTYYQGYRNFKVIPFNEINSTYLPTYESVYDKYSEVVKMYDEAMQVVALS